MRTLVSNWPVTFVTSSTSSAKDPDWRAPTLYLLKNRFVYLNLQYADSEELVADRDKRSGVANIKSSSLYFDKHVNAFVKAGRYSVPLLKKEERDTNV